MNRLRRPFPELTPAQWDDVERRLLSRVVDGENGCWVWTGALSPRGYGRISIGGRGIPVHRAMYVLVVGPVPPELDLDHLCRNPPCVNPAHLEPVTQRINVLRGDTVSARAAAATHCPAGHAYDEANTHIRPCGRRKCRACDGARSKRAYAARKARRAA